MIQILYTDILHQYTLNILYFVLLHMHGVVNRNIAMYNMISLNCVDATIVDCTEPIH